MAGPDPAIATGAALGEIPRSSRGMMVVGWCAALMVVRAVLRGRLPLPTIMAWLDPAIVTGTALGVIPRDAGG